MDYLAILIKKVFRLKDIKNFTLFVLICLFAYSFAEALTKIIAERTLGSIFRHFLPTTPYLILIVLVSLSEIKEFSFSNLIPSIPSKQEPNLIIKRFIFILLLGLTMGLFTINYLGKWGLLVGPIVVLLFISLFISCFYMMTEKKIFGLITYIVAIPFLFFIQGEWWQMGLQKLRISEIRIPLSAIFLILISICFFIGQYKNEIKEFSNEETNFIKLCLLFIFMPVFSIILSVNTSHSFIYYLLDLLLPFIYFFILLKLIKDMEDIKKLVLALIIAVFLYQFIALYNMYKQGSTLDITIGLYESNIFTGFTYIFIPLMIPFQVAMFNLLKGWKRLSIGLMLVTFIIYLLLSNYRTLIVASVIGITIFYFFLYRISLAKKIFFSISILLLLTIVVLYSENILEKLSYFRIIQSIQRFLSGESILAISSGRAEIWRSALHMIYDYPFFGIGPDMWSQYIWKYSSPIFWFKDASDTLRSTYAYDPHNLYFLIWVNYGILNIILYLSLLFIVTVKGLRCIKESSSKLMRNISLASFISLILWIVMSFFTMRFFNHSILLSAFIFWSIVAIIFKMDKFNTTLERESA